MTRKPLIFGIIFFTLLIAAFAIVVSIRDRRVAEAIAESAIVPPSPSANPTAVTPSQAKPAPAAVKTPAVVDTTGMVSAFNTKYGYPILGNSLCSEIDENTYAQELSDLDNAAGYLPEHESLVSYFNEAFTACQDHKVGSAEYSQLIDLHAQVGNHEGNLLKWQNIAPFEYDMSNYLASILGSETVPADCKVILATTQTSFMDKIASIESKYSAPSVGKDLRQALIDKQTTCTATQTTP